MEKNLIFVTGFFGAPIERTARHIAEKENGKLIFIDKEIEKADGRSIRRLCMMMGEHEYRNKEYEAIKGITEKYSEAEPCFRNDQNSTLPNSAPQSRSNAATSKALSKEHESLVICCGDGILLDDMSREIIKKHALVITGRDLNVNELWENAKKITNSYHAFMSLPDEKRKRSAFHDLYQRQLLLYNGYCR